MTVRRDDFDEGAPLDGYGEVIARARAAVPELSTETLVRIRAVLERALAGEKPGPEALRALAEVLDAGA